MRMKTRTLILIGAIIALIAGSVSADVPQIMTYQGLLADSSGTPYDGVENATFRIYNAGGGIIWTSGVLAVTFDDGLFAVTLGASPQPALPTNWFEFDTLLTLGITVNSDPEISPRTRFTTVGYSFQSQNSQKLGGLPPTSYANTTHDHGWQDNGTYLREVDVTDQVIVGRPVPGFTSTMFETWQYDSTKSGGQFHNFGNLAFRGAVNAFNYNDVDPSMAGCFSLGSTSGLFNEPSVIGASTQRVGAYGIQVRTVDSGSGVWAYAAGNDAIGIEAQTFSSTSVSVRASTTTGYSGYFTGGKGIYCEADSLYGGEFSTDRISSSAAGVYGHFDYVGFTDGRGVYGRSVPVGGYGYGGYFEGGYRGVYGFVNDTTTGVTRGVWGQVLGVGSGSRYGIYGQVSGATSGTSYGVYGTANGGASAYGVFSSGNCHVAGTLTKTAGAFRIDHPLDPENKYLQHSFVESSDMKNIYDGVVVLDESGRATVSMPDWFDALNKDFRYQLTCIGGYAPVYIDTELSKGAFSIAGGKAGMKVSWQVTGIRHDAYAQSNPIEVELVKAADEKGLYAHPDVFGQPESMGIDYVREHHEELENPARAAANAKLRNEKPPVQGKPAERKKPAEIVYPEKPSNQ